MLLWLTESELLQCNIFFIKFYFLPRKSIASKSSSELSNIEAEYIKNLQQQIYFLELEANYLYPFI